MKDKIVYVLSSMDSDESKIKMASLSEELKKMNATAECITSFDGGLAEHCSALMFNPFKYVMSNEEHEAILQYVKNGGGLLLLISSENVNWYSPHLIGFMKRMGVGIQKYHNHMPVDVSDFKTHYITANVKRIRVNSVAIVDPGPGASALAFIKRTGVPVLSCHELEKGRVVGIGDFSLFTDDFIEFEDNQKIVSGILRWLLFDNPIDIKITDVTEKVKYGESGRFSLIIQNKHDDRRPEIECVLESDTDAIIEYQNNKVRSIPPRIDTQMHWKVTPQILGDQKLRLTIHIKGDESLYFDQLPSIVSEAPGFISLTTTDESGKSRSAFDKDSYINVVGAFRWDKTIDERLPGLPYNLDLKHAKGFAITEHNPENGKWRLKAMETGMHDLALQIRETGQTHSVKIEVTKSISDQIDDLMVAFVRPLDVEIAERLNRVDERLSHDEIRNQPFQLLPPHQYIRELYDKNTVNYLDGILDSAYREEWFNIELLDSILENFCPVYTPDKGTLIPFDPKLASRLAELHMFEKKRLEYNFLCLEETDDISIRQNIATYLLHEKYGHGYFYSQTHLGRQLALLGKYGITNSANEKFFQYFEMANLVDDSSIVVTEGFSAWMEVSFLSQLDAEIRLAEQPRHSFIISETKGDYKPKSDYFQKFPQKHETRYREGYEYFEFIQKAYNRRCAIRAFDIANDIDFGIRKDHGGIRFEIEPSKIMTGLLETEDERWHSHLRLKRIIEVLYEHSRTVEPYVREYYCYVDEHHSVCPIRNLIKEKLNWRFI